MEWVETTGRTIEEAKDAALDQLGVDETDAEFVMVSEPKAGLFGRVRGEARVRARVRPTSPRPKRTRTRRQGEQRDARRARSNANRGPTRAQSGQKTGVALADGPDAESEGDSLAGGAPTGAGNGTGPAPT